MSDTMTAERTEEVQPSENHVPKYQSIACRKARPDDAQQEPPLVGYASPEDAAARCKELGHDVSDMEEHEDAYVFHQKAAPACKDAGTEMNLEDIEDGMKGVGCPKAAAPVQPGHHANPYEQQPNMRPATDKGFFGVYKAGHADLGGGERQAIAGGNADPVQRIPAGAQFIKDYQAHHDAGLAIHDDHAGLLENPPVAAANEAWQQEDMARAEEMDQLVGDLYPEVSFPGSGPITDDDGAASLPSMGQVPPEAKAAADMIEGGGPTPEIAEETGDGGEMPYGAQYFSKVAGHCDGGRTMLETGLAKQEHPKVIDFAEDEMKRLEKRKAACGKLMKKHYADHYEKVFGGDEPAKPSVEEPASDEPVEDVDTPDDDDEPDEEETKDLQSCVSRKIPIIAADHPEMSEDQRIAVAYSYCGEKKGLTVVQIATAVAKAIATGVHKAKPSQPKAAPASAKSSNAELLKQVVQSLASLIAAVKEKGAAKPSPAAKRPAMAKETPAAPVLDPDAAAEIAKLRGVLAKLVEGEKRIQAKLERFGKKKSACECGGTCGSCSVSKDLGTVSDAAGGVLVPVLTNDFCCDECGQKFKAAGDDATCPKCKANCKKIKPSKMYRIVATFKSRRIELPPGQKVPWTATDFRIEDQYQNVFDNRYWENFSDAEKMLMELV